MQAVASASDPIDRRSPVVPTRWGVWLMGIWIGLCYIGLLHEWAVLGINEEENVEAGMGLELQEDFEADVSAAPIQRKLGFLGLVAAGGYAFLTRPEGWRLRISSVLWFSAALIGWSVFSAVWSEDRSQTVRELIRVLAYVFVATSLAMRFPARDIVQIVVICMAMSVGLAYVGEITTGIFRPWASDFRMHGSVHSATLAHHALIVAIAAAALWSDSPHRKWWLIALLWALGTIVLSKTRGGLAAALAGVLAVQMLRSRPAVNLVVGCALLAVVVLTVATLAMGESQSQRRLGSLVSLGRGEQVTTLTGRLPLWREILRDSQSDRLLGAGYGAFFNTRRTFSLAKKLEWFPRHSHNAYLETIVDLGYVGLSLLIGVAASSIIGSARLAAATGNTAYLFVFGFLAAGLIDAFVEVMYVSVRDLGFFVGLSVSLLYVVHPADHFATARDTSPTAVPHRPARPARYVAI